MKPTRGYRKKEKTRAQLIAAGLRVLAAKGEATTVSDVVAEAGVANGTFYNYFDDREALIDELARELLWALVSATAGDGPEDPAMRFALSSARVLRRAIDDPTWARVVLRLVHRSEVHEEFDRFLREDLAKGYSAGRFDVGDDDATVDQVLGLLVMTMRRLVVSDSPGDLPIEALSRALGALGIDTREADELARDAWSNAKELVEAP